MGYSNCVNCATLALGAQLQTNFLIRGCSKGCLPQRASMKCANFLMSRHMPPVVAYVACCVNCATLALGAQLQSNFKFKGQQGLSTSACQHEVLHIAFRSDLHQVLEASL